MKYKTLIEMLEADITRNRERFKECSRDGRMEDAAIYAGKEMEARRVLMMIETGRI